MPICIECRCPVPQLYHVLHSSKPPASSAVASTVTSPAPGSAPPNPLSPPLGVATPATVNATFSRHASRLGGEAKRSGPAGADVRLMQCPRCKRFADKYVEHGFVVLFIDLVLVKPQVYRHLLFNRLGREDNAFDPSIIRLGTLLLLFDVYLTWSAIEALPASQTAASPVPRWPILAQYAFFLVLSTLAALAQHATIRALARLPVFRPAAVEPAPPAETGTRRGSDGRRRSRPGDLHVDGVDRPGAQNGDGRASATLTPNPEPVIVPATPTTPRASAPPLETRPVPPAAYQPPTSLPASGSNAPVQLTPPCGSAISTALFVSSCLKLFPILMVVWRYDDAAGGRAPGAPSALRVPAAAGGGDGNGGVGGGEGDGVGGGWGGMAGAGPTAVARGVAAAVAVQNLEALRIVLGVSHARAAALVAAGAGAQVLVLRAVLDVVGLGEGGMRALGWGGWW